MQNSLGTVFKPFFKPRLGALSNQIILVSRNSGSRSREDDDVKTLVYLNASD